MQLNDKHDAQALAPLRPNETPVAEPPLRAGIGARVWGYLAPGRSAPRPAVIDDPLATARPRARLGAPNLYVASFIVCVVLPAIASVLYLALFATDQYVAQAQFAVQSSLSAPSPTTPSGGTGTISIPSLTTPDAYVITNYIASRAIIDDLKGKVDIRAIYTRPEADFWARLKSGATSEELTGYWQGVVQTYVDTPSGIVTLTVRAFRADDAENLAQAIIAASEKLANDVSARARNAVMAQSEDEVRRSEGLVRDALAEMRVFRDKQGYIDPVASATSTSTLLLQLMGKKIELENNYDVSSKAMSPDAPSVLGLKSRLDELDRQIEQLKGKLAGDPSSNDTIASALGTFEALDLKKQFAEKLETMAQDSLERARLKAEQQNIFVSTFVPPSAPQESTYPQRLALSALIPVGLAMLWGIFALIGAAIADHRY